MAEKEEHPIFQYKACVGLISLYNSSAINTKEFQYKACVGLIWAMFRYHKV